MNAVVELKQGALAANPGSGRMAVADIIQHVAVVQEVMRAVMKPDVHYGTIPGTPKPTLYKQGAEVLCMVFRIADSYQVEDLSTPDIVRYRVTCIGTHQINNVVLGTGMGEASSGEEKYKWRKAICTEEFNETPANMRRVKHSRGKGGSTYKQEQIRTETADLANTILKMANKRAKIAMTINVTACGDMFGQDLDDMDEALRDHLARHGEEDAPATQAAPPTWPDAAFEKQLPKFRDAIAKGKTPEEIIAWAETKGALTDAQKTKLREPLKTEAAPAVTFAEVADKLSKASDRDALYLAADLINAVPEDQRGELNAIYARRETEIQE